MGLILVVFVTGNANKLKEVKAILAAGDSGIQVTSQAVDGKFSCSHVHICSRHKRPSRPNRLRLNIGWRIGVLYCRQLADNAVPEVQGTTQEVAIAKCQAAADKVSSRPPFLVAKPSSHHDVQCGKKLKDDSSVLPA